MEQARKISVWSLPELFWFKCSGISGELQNVTGFQCKICVAGKQAQLDMKQEVTLGIEGKLECVEQLEKLDWGENIQPVRSMENRR